jgi:hypothetical protein
MGATYNNDLTSKVAALLTDAVDPLTGAVNGPLGDLTDEQLDARDWGYTYGIALAIARAEDPFEPLSSVVDRARGAAFEAHAAWTAVTA